MKCATTMFASAPIYRFTIHYKLLFVSQFQSQLWRIPVCCLAGSEQTDPKRNLSKKKIGELQHLLKGAQWRSGRLLDSRPRGRGFEPQRLHCIVVFEQDTFIQA